ncbi:hypothetical protein [uncultured Clostridium sp.]|uniref:hypothetical protein n=1 Tax=uncultured Clostridium sp. TaxID=59620 RepID=UPI0025EE483D|nr:hypothetical protein [uncultured Clostridium sp.]
MDLVMMVLITAIVLWKNGYTFYLIFKFYKDKNRKEAALNIVFLLDYIIYYYFVFLAASNSIESPFKGPLWLIITFIILTACNILYDLKLLNFKKV